MRRARLRALLAAGALAATGGLVVLIAPGASADLVAPYDALTLDPSAAGYISPTGLAFDDSNATFSATPMDGGLQLNLTPTGHLPWYVNVIPPTGATLAVGTYSTLRSPDATHAGLDIGGDGRACNQDSGTLNVTQVTRDPGTQAITALAATYSQRCELTQPPLYGEVRYKSTVGYAAVTSNLVGANFGTVLVGQAAPVTTMTLTGAGTTPTILGAGALTGTGASSFAITQDTCSGKSLAYGQTCAVSATVTPQHVGDLTAAFVIPDNTGLGQRTFSLSATGTSLARALTSPNSLDFGTVKVGQSSGKAQTITITSIGSANLVLGQATLGGPNASSFAIGADTCSGQSVAPNATCTIGLTATPTQPGTATATLLIPDNTDAKSQTVSLTVLAPSAIDATTDPTDINFGTVPVGQSSAGQTVTITSVGVQNVVLQQAAIAGSGASAFAVLNDNCSGATLAPNTKCTLMVKASPTAAGTFTATLTIPDNTPAGARTVTLSVSSTIGAAGTYYPITPSRLMDTRIGQGAPRAPIGPGGVVHLQVTGRGGVPLNGVGAVVLNVTVAGPTADSYLSLYPTGVRRPVASSLDFPKGWTGANSVTVAVGAGGKVDIYNLAGSTPTIVDVLGFYASSDAVLASNGLGGQFQPFIPSRLLDTRKDGGALPSRFVVTVPIDFGDDINSHIRAFAVNITAVSPGSQGFLSAWNGIGAPPKTSTLNFTKGATVANMAIVPAAPCDVDPSCAGMPAIGVYNASLTGTQVLVDIVGVFDDSTLDGGMRFHPMAPTRITDTRIKQGVNHALVGNQTVTITTPSSVAGPDTFAIAANVTPIAPTKDTYLTLWPGGLGLSRPTVSNLDPAHGQTIPNAAICGIGPNFEFNVYNLAGTVNLAIDVVGTYDLGITEVPSTSLTAATTLAQPDPKLKFRATKPRATPLSGDTVATFQTPA